jgi:hypothetical protein
MEDLILLGSFQVLLVLVIVFSRKTRRQKTIHLGILAVYCAVFYWLMFNRGDGGSSFVWLFYLAILSLAHLIWLLVAPVVRKV